MTSWTSRYQAGLAQGEADMEIAHARYRQMVGRKEKNMIIVGAGMAGLLCAHYFRHHNPIVMERGASLPNNHGALLRFRSRAVMDITGAPLKEVRVRKAILERSGELSDRCSLLHANAYSHKVTGVISNRSIEDLSPVTRWVAEPDFLAKLARGVNIDYNAEIVAHDDIRQLLPVISTAPMKMWTDHMGMDIDYQATPIQTIQTEVYGIDVHQTVYIPWGGATSLYWAYRGSFVGNQLILEGTGDRSLSGDEIRSIIQSFCLAVLGQYPKHGAILFSSQKLGKIVPLPTDQRRHILGKITERYGIYSIGRFAVWRQILLDDVVNDLKVVERLMNSGEYARQLHYAGEPTNV